MVMMKDKGDWLVGIFTFYTLGAGLFPNGEKGMPPTNQCCWQPINHY
jgi:hypothetical protein